MTVQGWFGRVPAVALTAACLVLGVLAYLHPGISTAQVDVNDGGVWVTNNAKQLVGHVNIEAYTIDAALRTKTDTFDIGQAGDTVTMANTSGHSLAPVDAANVRLSSSSSVPEGALAAQGGERIGVLDPESGQLWTGSAARPSDISFDEGSALASDLRGGSLAAGTDGTIAAVSAYAGRALIVKMAGHVQQLEEVKLQTAADATLSITLVGVQPVILDSDANTLILPGTKNYNLSEQGIPTGAVLQEPGPDADHVLLATATGMVSVKLDGSEIKAETASSNGESGTPARPVRLGACEYGVWASSGAYYKSCDGSEPVKVVSEQLKTAAQLVFRTNRNVIVVNDLVSGNVWVADDNMIPVTGWEEIDTQLNDEEDKEESSTETNQVTDPDRTQNTPPEANDDEFGVRPGKTTTLDVLANDSDPDGDVLTASKKADAQLEFGEVVPTRGGRALQIDVPDSASGTTVFGYTASDGTGTDDAQVSVSVHPWGENAGPNQLREDPNLKLGSRGTIRYNVLPDWRDPDGDPIYLKSASTQDTALEVRYQEEGTITMRELGGQARTVSIDVVVSDGDAHTNGTLVVHVDRSGNLAPVAYGDFYVARMGEVITVRPLDNDFDPNGDALSLTANSPPDQDAVLTPDLELGTIAFSAKRTGTFSFTYTVSDGRANQVGVVRVEVIEAGENQQPVAEDDLALLPPGGSTLLAPLDNDSDPSGGVLVLQAINVPEASALEVVVIDHHLLRISAPAGLSESTTFEYTISNGMATASGEVLVVPTRDQDQSLPPELNPDRAVVRVGDVGSVDVLDNDRSPSGETLSVQAGLMFNAETAIGKPFVTGNLVRLQAFDTPGVMEVMYTVMDASGRIATSSVVFEVVDASEVNAAPRPEALTAWAVAGQTSRIVVPLIGIDPDGDSVTLVGIERPPAKGNVVLGTDWLEYTPGSGQQGTDTFSYIVEDRLGKQGTATVRVGVAAPAQYNQNPRAVADTVSARPGRSLLVPVLANDSDPDGDEVQLEAVEALDENLNAEMVGSSVALDTPGEGTYLVDYRIADGRGGFADGLLTVVVDADSPLRSPLARDDVVAVADVPTDGQPVTVDVLANDSDPDGSLAALELTCEDEGCTVKGGRLQIAPDDGRRMVVYTITDPDGLSGSAVVSVPGKVQAAPHLRSGKSLITVRAGEQHTFDITEIVETRVGRSPRLADRTAIRSSAGFSQPGTAIDDTRIEFTAAPDFSGLTSMSFEVRDGDADDRSTLSATITVEIMVEATENHPPTFTPMVIPLEQGGAATRVDLALMTTDPDGQDPTGFEYAITQVPGSVSAQITAGHFLEVSAPAGSQKGPIGEVSITVSDGGEPVSASLPLVVQVSTRKLIALDPDIQVLDANVGQTSRVDLNEHLVNPFPEPVRLAEGSLSNSGEEASVTTDGLVVSITPKSRKGDGQILVQYSLLDATGEEERKVHGRIHVTVRDRPDPPTNVDAVKTSGTSAMVSFTSGNTNGASLDQVQVFVNGESEAAATCPATATACEVKGLAAGGKYTFKVKTHNAAGWSEASAASPALLVDEVPQAPTGAKIKAGDGEVVVTWNASKAGGSKVTGYEVALSDGSVKEVSADTLTVKFSGLQNGQRYSAVISAHNALTKNTEEGTSPMSAQTGQVTPWGTPHAPAKVEYGYISSGDANIKICFTYPSGASASDNNGRPVEAKLSVSGSRDGDCWKVKLPVGEPVSVKVWFENSESERNKSDSTSSPVFTPVSAPVAPGGAMNVAATGNNNELKVSDIQKAAGNGFSASDLKLQWSAGGDWHALECEGDCTLSSSELPNGQAVTLSFRQVGTVEGELGGPITIYSPAVSSAPATPYGPLSDPSLSVDWTSEGLRIEYNADGNGRALTSAVLDWGSGPVDVLADGAAHGHKTLTFAQTTGRSEVSFTVSRGDDTRAASANALQGAPKLKDDSIDETHWKILINPGKWEPGEGRELVCRYVVDGEEKDRVSVRALDEYFDVKEVEADERHSILDEDNWTCRP
ncbi:MAG: fibronectin type III domain-containing protein [Propionibacteriaceae bacterium]|jgi:hypothetical protein|nr:fibronectin type III domain-containing protein [Propionibacteriaceae bacterium]